MRHPPNESRSSACEARRGKGKFWMHGKEKIKQMSGTGTPKLAILSISSLSFKSLAQKKYHPSQLKSDLKTANTLEKDTTLWLG